MVNFTAQDRCDRCGAQALHRATNTAAKSDLLFCGHHYRKHEDALFLQAWEIESDLSPISPQPAAAYTE